MLIHHLSQPRVMSPMTGHQRFIAPLTSYRRPAIAPREPQLPLETRK